MMDLEAAGIVEGISEVIVTTTSGAGAPNAAPIGLITQRTEVGDLRYSVKLYRGSQTLANVRETRTLAANVTDDVVVFVTTAFADLRAAYFTVFEAVPVLKDANAWIVFSVTSEAEYGEYVRFLLQPERIKINRKAVTAINRGRNAVLEAAIIVTRIDRAEDERAQAEMREQVKNYKELVMKCGGPREHAAMRLLEAICSDR
ncbi:MAG TPA: DUF447 family protein [Methanomicrobia archaeon]|nr:DUF447 family protein [Methanomicrobia archaeon]